LRNSFKNFRRNYDDDEDPTDTDDQIAAAREPPAKRRRYYNEDEPEMGDEEYDAAIEELNEEYTLRKAGKKGKGHGRVKELMELTKARRVHWICEDKPLISEILQKFPFLKTNRWVSNFISKYIDYVFTFSFGRNSRQYPHLKKTPVL